MNLYNTWPLRLLVAHLNLSALFRRSYEEETQKQLQSRNFKVSYDFMERLGKYKW